MWDCHDLQLWAGAHVAYQQWQDRESLGANMAVVQDGPLSSTDEPGEALPLLLLAVVLHTLACARTDSCLACLLGTTWLPYVYV